MSSHLFTTVLLPILEIADHNPHIHNLRLLLSWSLTTSPKFLIWEPEHTTIHCIATNHHLQLQTEKRIIHPCQKVTQHIEEPLELKNYTTRETVVTEVWSLRSVQICPTLDPERMSTSEPNLSLHFPWQENN
jgi:hypothetical protein